ncbi:lipid IV(A) 3-deoxy-D-manno-octulosonic acid transferase [Maricurvus nonylphenolicus]|uniref:lipid IV(A) 3-deoxy-D-manno-octulosonic acid transferase n=1 Tax=Maricurvus nonylphenolicus TaxID=1008307 RepID=UPI0036F30CF2
MRYLYTAFFYLITPFILLRLLWRSRLAPAYAKRWQERFGFFGHVRAQDSIWVHAVSVGETLAALPMIKSLMQRYPDTPIVVTTTTPTGSERVKAALGDSVLHVYAPYDMPGCVGRFLNRVQPKLAIIMETELWPNTVAACHRRGIPVVLANARLSAKSAKGYQRFSALAAPMLSQLSVVGAQHHDDAQRFYDLGLSQQQCQVTGSIKFDITLGEELRSAAQDLHNDWADCSGRPILLAASTHLGEDEKVLQGFHRILEQQPTTLLVLVPRHPERFDKVADLCRQQFTIQRRSEGGRIEGGTQVLVGDTMGEMMTFFGACDMAFMGGSWIESGGHNMIEPAAWGKPVFTGPSLFNFAEVSRLLIEAEGMGVVDTPEALASEVCRLIENPDQAKAMGENALAVADANRGALDRLLAIIDQQFNR